MAYERNNFKTGQVLTADALNHMEDGIAMAMEGGGVTATTYAELKALRDAGQLKAGAFYRITDYMTTTTQENTQSAGHQFDVIVLALDGSRLSEKAWAAHHDGDEYFKDSNLSAWQIWYCLDNDETRFAWADAENGKGVIYRMIDEFGNDIPYDFKTIMYALSSPIVDVEISAYNSWFKGVFTRKESSDTSYNGEDYYAWEYRITAGPGLSGIVFSKERQLSLTTTFYSETFEPTDIIRITNIVDSVYTFNGADDLIGVSHNNVVNPCYSGFIQELNYIRFGNKCVNITIGNNCNNITFGDDCNNNTFGNDCNNNTFGNSCTHNAIGNSCKYNTFGKDSRSNTLGNGSSYITFGDYCGDNTIGNNCHNNTFGNTCYYITLGNNCTYNTIGNSCTNNAFSDSCGSAHLDEGANKKHVGKNSNGETVIKNLFD